MLIIQKSQGEIQLGSDEYHVLTYAEEGFAPLNIHAEPAGISKDQLVEFCSQINERGTVGTLLPKAPISAVPRSLIRELKNTDALAQAITDFVGMNNQTIRAAKLLCDFRTPKVERFVVLAIEKAMNTAVAPTLDEVIIIM